MLDAGIIKAAGYAEGGWVTGLKYEDEIREDLKARTSGKADELRLVCPLSPSLDQFLVFKPEGCCRLLGICR